MHVRGSYSRLEAPGPVIDNRQVQASFLGPVVRLDFQREGKLMENCCAICDTAFRGDEVRFRLADRRKGLKGEWSLVECGSCNAIAICPTPSVSQLGQYYENYSTTDEASDYELTKGSKYPSLRKLYHLLSGDVDPRDFVEISGNQRILDYGCGYGAYLVDFHNAGTRACGIEVAPAVVDSCRERGLDVRLAPDDGRIPFNDREFDVIYLMQVLEHLPNPDKFLSELNRTLKTNGQLYVAVPNSESIWRFVFRKHWVSGWFSPFHLFHYNAGAITRILKSNGFELEWVRYRTPESWFRLNLKAVLYRTDRNLDVKASWLDARLIRLFLMCVVRVIEIPFRQRDCLFVKATKISSVEAEH